MLPSLAFLLFAVKLYLTDGSYQSVREYQINGDRVRYYSTERGDWEEIPLDLVDLKKTKAETEAKEAARKEDTAAAEAEDKAEREQRREIARIPQEAGVYFSNGKDLEWVKPAEAKIVSDRKRSVLKAITPIPILAGKSTVEVDGLNSTQIFEDLRPEFYMRLSAEERFTIVKAVQTKTSRVIEKWSLIPVSKELLQEHADVEVFRHQVGDNLYKIWPQKPLEPGEYAIIQYTEGKGNTQVWDFAVRKGAK